MKTQQDLINQFMQDFENAQNGFEYFKNKHYHMSETTRSPIYVFGDDVPLSPHSLVIVDDEGTEVAYVDSRDCSIGVGRAISSSPYNWSANYALDMSHILRICSMMAETFNSFNKI